MSSVPLFELVAQYRAILARVDDADGEVSAEVAAELDALAPTIESKIEAYAAVDRELAGQAAANAAMAEHYTRRKERLLNQREQLRDRLFEAMQAAELRRIEAPTATASIQKSPAKLVVTDETAAVAAGFSTVVVKLDTTRLKAALADGNTREFAHLETSEHLRLK